MMENINRISSEEMVQWRSDLENCVATGDSESILELLRRFPINTTDDVGKTLLHYVTKTNDDNDGSSTKMQSILLEAGCKVNAKTEDGSTALDYILMNCRGEAAVKAAKTLLDAGASRDHTYYKDSYGPLHKACSNQDPKMVELLLVSKFEASATDNSGRTPLHIVFHAGKSTNADDNDDVTNIVRLLIKAGADVNAKRVEDGKCPLHLAVLWKNNNAFDLLQEAGAEVDVVDNRGNTPLHMATTATKKHFRFAKRLVDAGADINKKNSDQQISPFLFNVIACASVQGLTFCIAHGAKLDFIDGTGTDLLTNALICWANNYKTKTLEGNPQNRNQNQLLDHDTRVEETWKKEKIKDQIECLEIMCKYGLDVNRVSKNGNTALGITINMYCHSKLLWTLFREGVIVNFGLSKIRNIMYKSNYNLGLQKIFIQHAAICNTLKKGKGIDNFDLHKLNRTQKYYYEMCLKELNKIKKFKVYGSMCLNNLIEGPVTSHYIQSDCLIQLFETGEIATSFPTFNEILADRFEEKREKYKLLQKACVGLRNLILFNEDRSYDLVYKNILNCLEKNDLRNLAPFANIKTSEPTD